MITQQEIQHKIDFKTKPLGALGQLERIAKQICTIQQTLNPEIRRPAMLVFAGDHGLTEEKISPFPKDVTWQMVMNFVAEGAAINVFCKQNGFEIKVIDAGVDYDFPAELPVVNAKVAYGTKNMMKEPAMSLEQCEQAMEKGKAFVRAEKEAGSNTIGFGEMGIGNTSASALLMSYFTEMSIADCVGAGTGMAGDQLTHKQKVLEQVKERYQAITAIDALSIFGGFEIAMMVGAYLEAKAQNMLILVDGFISTAACLTAYNMDATVFDNCIFCHTSEEKGHKAMLEVLNAEPILNLGLRLGEGTGAAVALPIIKSAVNFMNEMASFEDAGVDNKD